MNITRRLALGGMAALPATIAIPASARPQHPLERLRALHDEASALMADYDAHMDGRWELNIRAPSDPVPVRYTSLCLSPQCRVAMAQAELIAATKALHTHIRNWRVIRPEDVDGDGSDIVGMFMICGHPDRGWA
ncbi:hypothetical protein [Mesorhizobium sp. J428]|uniref:hypothetical protein n=1 Tax=Mesorhizobium sp. J428 TaxID=2898440 RepID=UPI002150FD34|nr:hypothetical protein [Mesorhizobium sp. J428]MCR5856585.1 hypothetical protein [Mesorhizobium sp. J428]